MRVVSLVPSATATLASWGVEPVACTRFCERPDLPHVGGTKDPRVPDVVALRPDLVVVDEEENRREDHDALVDAGVPVLATCVRSLADLDHHLARLAAAVGVAAPTPVGPTGRPAPVATAFVPIWKRPWMTVGAGTYAADLLAAAGLRTAFADRPDRYPTLDEDELVGGPFDLVLAPDEPYPFAERHRLLLERFSATVRFVDGKDVTWWGERTTGALARLRRIASEQAGAP